MSLYRLLQRKRRKARGFAPGVHDCVMPAQSSSSRMFHVKDMGMQIGNPLFTLLGNLQIF